MIARPHSELVAHAGALRRFESFAGSRVVVVEGCGRDGHGIVREVTYWFDENGELIFRYDPTPHGGQP